MGHSNGRNPPLPLLRTTRLWRRLQGVCVSDPKPFDAFVWACRVVGALVIAACVWVATSWGLTLTVPLPTGCAPSIAADGVTIQCTFAPTGPPTPPASKRYFTYFGYGAGNAAGQADHVNMIFVPEWGETDANLSVILQRNISFFNEAKAAGIPAVVLDVGFQAWRGTAVNPTLAADLTVVLKAYQTAGVLGMVKAIYPVDEPDIRGFSDASLRQANAIIRQVADGFPELSGVQLWVIYAQDGVPAMSSFDCVGSDHYGDISRALAWYAQVPAAQCRILVPGGAQPWRDDPAPFTAYAMANPNTNVIAFLWVDYSGGLGISDNGMLPAYRAAGKTVIGK